MEKKIVVRLTGLILIYTVGSIVLYNVLVWGLHPSEWWMSLFLGSFVSLLMARALLGAAREKQLRNREAALASMRQARKDEEDTIRWEPLPPVRVDPDAPTMTQLLLDDVDPEVVGQMLADGRARRD